MKKIYLILIAVSTLISCSSNDDDNTTLLNIRISNTSQFNFENVVFNASTSDTNIVINIASLNSGESTEYISVEAAESFPFVELQIDGNTYTLLPLSTGFDMTINEGNYTYQINANDSLEQYGKLSYTLVNDL